MFALLVALALSGLPGPTYPKINPADTGRFYDLGFGWVVPIKP